MSVTFCTIPYQSQLKDITKNRDELVVMESLPLAYYTIITATKSDIQNCLKVNLINDFSETFQLTTFYLHAQIKVKRKNKFQWIISI